MAGSKNLRNAFESSSKNADLKLLSREILTIAQSIKQDAAKLKQSVSQNGGGCKGYNFNFDFDFGRFNRSDLQVLQPALKKLHQVCKEADVSVDFQGLDLLPRVALVANHMFTTPATNGFLVLVDAGRKYNFFFNPFSEQEFVANTGKKNHKDAPDQKPRQ